MPRLFPGWPDADGLIAAFLASLVMAFLLGFFLEATMGMIGFWFLEVSSLLFVYMLFSFFFSGHMFPIDMLPGSVEDRGQAHAAAIPGLFSRRGFSGQDRRRRTWLGDWSLNWAGCVFICVCACRLALGGRGLTRSLQRLWRMT